MSSTNSSSHHHLKPLKTSFASESIAALMLTDPYRLTIFKSNLAMHRFVKTSTFVFIRMKNPAYRKSDSGLKINFWTSNSLKLIYSDCPLLKCNLSTFKMLVTQKTDILNETNLLFWDLND